MDRRSEREQAFVLVFEKAFNPETPIEDIFALAIESEFMKPSDFATELAIKTYDNIDVIDEKIKEFALGWTIERLTKVSLSILRIAICEILYMDDIPESVSINEAVELAKKYAGKEDSSFINGVLGSLSRAK